MSQGNCTIQGGKKRGMNTLISTLGRKNIKPIVAALASYFIVLAYWLVVTGMGFFTSPHSGRILLALVLGWFGCFFLSLINTRSLLRGVVGATVGYLLGIFLAYVVLIPFASGLVGVILPYKGVLLSASVNFAWILLGIISVIEWVTEGVIQRGRIFHYLAAAISLMVIVYLVEFVTRQLGPQSQLETWRVIFYAPLIWGLIVYFTNRTVDIA
jgi:hypothetical protein